MKGIVLSIALVSLSGCSGVTGEGLVRPLIEPTKTFVDGSDTTTYRADYGARRTNCDMHADRHLFLACMGGYKPSRSFDKPENRLPRGSVGSADLWNPIFFPFGANPGGTGKPIYVETKTYGTASFGGSGNTYPGNCETPEDLDIKGNKCGGRSATARPGGY